MIISNSEVIERLLCERMHYYHYGMGIEPKRFPIHLIRGIIGHLCLETYYKCKQSGGTEADCRNAGHEVLDVAFAEHLIDPKYAEAIARLKEIFNLYVDYYWNEPWRILEVEETHIVDLDSLISGGLKPDLVVEITAPPDKGRIAIIDHKFTYNFWSKTRLDVDPQLPKYTHQLRMQGYDVKRAFVNMIRYRGGDEYFRREPIHLDKTIMANLMAEHVDVSHEIVTVKSLSLKEQSAAARRTRHYKICEWCPFLDPCQIELRGGDPSLTLTTQYQPSTYGYHHDDIED